MEQPFFTLLQKLSANALGSIDVQMESGYVNQSEDMIDSMYYIV